MSLRSFTLSIIVVVAFTCGMLWLNREDLSPGYASYEKYGISLTYPALMSLRETTLPGMGSGPDLSDFAGFVALQSYWEGKLDTFGVAWFVKERAPSVEAEGDEFIKGISQQPNEVMRRVGERFDMVFNGEAVGCICIELQEGSNTFSGVGGVIYRPWSSPGVSRIFIVFYLTFKGSATEAQMRASLQKYVEGLSISPT